MLILRTICPATATLVPCPNPGPPGRSGLPRITRDWLAISRVAVVATLMLCHGYDFFAKSLLGTQYIGIIVSSQLCEKTDAGTFFAYTTGIIS
ncbi:unnamed protein product [Leptosia nina]|uniref:Uncharacterized protein n=1 Tax=Leptosia nina TaxID=320188 RepID=A0AAV1J753_9NEOP